MCIVISRLRIALSVLAVASAAACGRGDVEQIKTTAIPEVSVEAATVGPLEGVLTVNGIVTPGPGAEWTIVAPEPARIAELPKAEGDPVRVGDLLVRYDIPSRPADLSARQAELAQATARLATAKAAVTRLSGLVERGVAAPREVEEAKRDQTDAEAAVSQAQSAVTAVDALGKRLVVVATFPGAIAKRWHNPGDLVDASATDPILRVIDPARLQVLAAVPVGELRRLVVGRPARIGGADGIAGRVVSLPVAVETDRATADVRIAATTRIRLPAGAPVSVDITTAARPNAVVVSTSAVGRNEDGAFVMIAGADKKAHRTAVVTGVTAGDRVEITTGVAAGDLVIVRGQDGLPDGADITIAK